MLHIVEIFQDDLPLQWQATGRADVARKIALTARSKLSRYYFKIYTIAEYDKWTAGYCDAPDKETGCEYVAEFMTLDGIDRTHCNSLADAQIEEYLYWIKWLEIDALAVYVGDADGATHFMNSTTGHEKLDGHKKQAARCCVCGYPNKNRSGRVVTPAKDAPKAV